jgi:phosphoribosyl 1,2-cyclic phosphodiesterase
MEIRFFGVRGSIPAPGPSTARYGGNTVCVQVTLADGTILVFDAGTGLRELGKVLAKGDSSGPYHLLLSHIHWDHIIGLPFFGPLYNPDTHLLLYPLANEVQTKKHRKQILFDGVHFPVRSEDIPAKLEEVGSDAGEWRIGSATVKRVNLNHPGGAQGFRVDDVDGKSFAYLTDNELSPPGVVTTALSELAAFAKDVDVLAHDAQYIGEDMPKKHGWGHSTIDDALKLAKESGTKRIVLFHHEPERDDDALDVIDAHTKQWMKDNAGGADGTVAFEGLNIKL